VVYRINFLFRRFGCGTGQLSGLIVYYIAPRPKYARRGSSVSRPHDRFKNGRITWTCDQQRVYHHHGPWRDHLFHDRPTCARSRSRCSRPGRGRPKVPFSWCRCHILVVDYRWGSMWPNETATATTGGPRVIDVFYGNGAPSGPNCTLFSGADRFLEASRGRFGGG
jgi:hypothetical protein